MSDYTAPTAPVAPPAALNVLSVVGFVVSLFGFNVIAIILGAIGLSQIKRTGERGRGFALAAIWIGAISIAAIVVIVVVLLATSAALQLSTT